MILPEIRVQVFVFALCSCTLPVYLYLRSPIQSQRAMEQITSLLFVKLQVVLVALKYVCCLSGHGSYCSLFLSNGKHAKRFLDYRAWGKLLKYWDEVYCWIKTGIKVMNRKKWSPKESTWKWQVLTYSLVLVLWPMSHAFDSLGFWLWARIFPLAHTVIR